MRLISLYDDGELMDGFIEDATEYIHFWIEESKKKPYKRQTYPKSRFGEYETFRAIFSQFHPDVYFLTDPVEIEGFSYGAVTKAKAKLPPGYLSGQLAKD